MTTAAFPLSFTASFCFVRFGTKSKSRTLMIRRTTNISIKDSKIIDKNYFQRKQKNRKPKPAVLV
uniref:Uncharacterized protein n=1 Tax=Siphoviridae sp. ctfM019 TaxID=2827908 RepID=A0A8S5SSD6_9CAUD|nr:MAG TPA: hypothetical protein [Siphoviridae sp. ctfM019]